MATIMEKEVLIEVVASSLALISRKLNYQEYLLNNNEGRNRLIEIRNYLYSTWPHEIDYEKILSECKAIKQEYQR
ncbi:MULTISPECIES: hypothetical protein [Neisseria]|uniref:hypothetical protein n=1 Tax=Neisseria TaxID=482 RepID=UPI00272C0F2F|nr:MULTISPECIES: hypothetical protein [Neisseria]